MLTARGEWILFADADGATRFADLDELESETKKILMEGCAIGIGSRAHMQHTEAVVKVDNSNFCLVCNLATLTKLNMIIY